MTLKILAGLAVGGVFGFGWYRLVGCASGACPLTSHPLITTACGALIGLLVALG